MDQEERHKGDVLILAFEEVAQEVVAYSIMGRIAPVYDLRRMFVSVPQFVPVSFFRRPSFLINLATIASGCVFHVRRVFRVTPRKVGLSTCGTGMSSSFSITFSFTVVIEKSVACVLLQLISRHHSCAQELTLLMVSWMACVAVEVCFLRGPCSQVFSM